MELPGVLQSRGIKTVWTYLKGTLDEFSNDNGPSMAAAIAYYTAFSLPPLLVLILTVTGIFVNPADVQGEILAQLQSLLGPDGAAAIQEMITEGSKEIHKGGIGAIIGGVVLLLGATGAFVELQSALNRAWGVRPDPNQGGVKGFIVKRIASLGMVLGVAFLLLVSLVMSALISLLGDWISSLVPALSGPFLWVLDLLLSLLLFTLMIGTIYKVLPDAELTWKDVRAGAFVTAVLFVVGKFAIGVYLGNSDVGSVFGAAGSLAIILTWIYYSAMILLIGAEFTQVWTQQHGRSIVPEDGALKVTETVVTVEDRHGRQREERQSGASEDSDQTS